MNKIAIPALLVATIMVAGAFAFVPVEQASTVHLSAATTGNSMKLVVVTDTCIAGADADCLVVTVNVDDGAAYKILSIQATAVDQAGANMVLQYEACTANGIVTDLVLANLAGGGTDTDFSVDGNASVGIAAANDIVCEDTAGSNVDDTDVIDVTMVIEMTANAADPVMTITVDTP